MERTLANSFPPVPQGILKAQQLFFEALRKRVSDDAAILWTQVSKAGSNLTDFPVRPHSALQSILAVDPADADTVRNKHVSNADLKVNADHRAASSAHGSNGNIVGFSDLAGTSTVGLVKKAVAVTDASASAVSVTSADAGTMSAGYVQTEAQRTATLADELKADVNTLVTDTNLIKTQLNALLAALRTSGSVTV